MKIFSAKLGMILPQSGVCILFKKKTKKNRSANSLSERETARFVGINDHFEAEPLSCL